MEEIKLNGKWYVKGSISLQDFMKDKVGIDVRGKGLWHPNYFFYNFSPNFKNYRLDYSGVPGYKRISFKQFKKFYYESTNPKVVEKEFVLPNEWAIKTCKEVGDWLDKNSDMTKSGRLSVGYANTTYPYLLYPSLHYSHIFPSPMGRVEITYEQFKKYVLKEEETMTESKQIEQPVETYRFKTKEEFIAEYGADFCNKVKYQWESGGKMDYLFGVSITKEEYDHIISDKGRRVWYEELTSRSSSWNISTDMITNKPLINKTMKENFSIGGSAALKKAFVEEAGLKLFGDGSIPNFKYLTSYGCSGASHNLQGVDAPSPKHFTLPQDWDAALAYVKDFYTPEKKVTEVYFGKLKLTIKEGENFATTEQGKITKEEIRKVLAMFTSNTICGYSLTMPNLESLVLKFGCVEGTVADARKVFKAFN